MAFIRLSLALPPEQVQAEIPSRDGNVVLTADIIKRLSETRYWASGNVRIVYKDWTITGDQTEYDESTHDGYIDGHARFSQSLQWLNCSRAEFNFGRQTGIFYNATGYIDRQFFLTGRTIRKTGEDTYTIENLYTTSCAAENPKWNFSATRAYIDVNGTARLHSMTFKIKGVPVFYSPYLIIPMEKKERSSGFVPFHTGTSTTKGRVLSEGYYQVLGESADVLIYEDYFTLRGLAMGGKFRARPNPETNFTLQAYGIKDKLGDSGIWLVVDGDAQLKDDWRAVAKVNITSNFEFRQVFSDSFRESTVSQERAIVFLTRDHSSFSTNIAVGRDEVYFPQHDLIIKKIPSLEFVSLGTPIGRSPFILSFRTSLDGVSRMDSLMDTQGLIQRLDFFPNITVRLPSILGFSIVPTVGVRETYYSAQATSDTQSGIINNGLHRRYTDVSIDVKTPILERSYSSKWLGQFQHRIEPFITYRWINGITDFDKTIRFDEEDAIADTNEIEYGIINRFVRNRRIGSGNQQKQEFMSFGLIQKFYLDPTFSGAFRSGQSNSFFPLDSVTGFYQTGVVENFSPLSAIFQLSPSNGIHNDLRADYDVKLQGFRNVSLATSWNKGKMVVSGTYVKTLPVETGMFSANSVQGQIGVGSTKRGLSSSLTLSYNLRTAQLLNSQTKVGYMWDCCGLSMEFNQYNIGIRTESRFSFSFSLKGIGSFGDIKHPESLF